MHWFKSGIFLLTLFMFTSAGRAPREKTQWISLQEAMDRCSREPRPILIDLYTTWCGWCKVMDKQTYSKSQVARYLGDKFYTVRIDAEGRNDIRWKGKTFSYNPAYKVHDFAVYLTGGQLAFPTTVILPADGSAPQAIPGYLEPAQFEVLVKYFGEGHFGRQSFAQFREQFKSSW